MFRRFNTYTESVKIKNAPPRVPETAVAHRKEFQEWKTSTFYTRRVNIQKHPTRGMDENLPSDERGIRFASDGGMMPRP